MSPIRFRASAWACASRTTRISSRRALPVDFVEVISENFMVEGGRPLDVLRAVRERHPVALHGVSMSIGSADGAARRTISPRLRALVDAIEPLFVSDHLSWSRIGGFNSHDLLPLPYTDEALDTRLRQHRPCAGGAGPRMLLENPSSYIALRRATMTEWEFLDAMCARTGCGLLLDVNNIFVSASNHGFDAMRLSRGHSRAIASARSISRATARGASC